MANEMRYFIGNWKMFGVPKSINIVNKINSFVKLDKKDVVRHPLVMKIIEAYDQN